MPISRPPLAVSQILAWAEAHHAYTGLWPHAYSGRSRTRRGRTGTTSTARSTPATGGSRAARPCSSFWSRTAGAGGSDRYGKT